MLSTYIETLRKYNHPETDIGDQAWLVLGEFARHQYISAYKVYSNFKSRGLKVDYKNTYSRVVRLADLGFIERVKAKEFKGKANRRRAIYYRISEAGMFRLFYGSESVNKMIQSEVFPSIFSIVQNNGDRLVFETLLYPYFEKETLAALHDAPFDDATAVIKDIGSAEGSAKGSVVGSLWTYLDGCCAWIGWLLMQYDLFVHDKDGLASATRILQIFLTARRDDLIMNILRLFGECKDTERLDALAILARDNTFMKGMDYFHKNLERSYNLAMRMGKRL